MPINKIEKRAGTTHLENLPNAAGFGYDSDDGFTKYNDAGTIRTIVDTAKTQTISGTKTFSGTVTFSGAVSNTATGQIRFATTTITNTQFTGIRAAPVTLVAAPGAGFALQFLGATISIDYTAAYTETADNLSIRYTDGSGQKASADIETTGWVDLTADSMVNVIPLATGPQLMTANAALVLHNIGDGEFGGGNAANVITATVIYRVIAHPL
jgi:hypothetical protein